MTRVEQMRIYLQLNRTIAVDEPRVTTFPIVWDEQQPTDQLVFAELTDEEKKLAETNDELEICQSLENVNCTNETDNSSNELTKARTTDERTLSTTTINTTDECNKQ
jgi:hypothetical protein